MSNRTVAIAGASGFVGASLRAALATRGPVIALARATRPASEGITWRACDLFSLTSTRAALAGAKVAVYLVHSMMPSSRLFQGDFHDTDLLLADNFAKASVANGVERIIYLGGLIPDAGYVSPHLASRKEVEEVLLASGVPVTVLRAGMVVGPGGSSFEILRTLVERLPAMILPKWTQSQGQSVFIDDVVDVLVAAVGDEAFTAKTFDLVNGESLTYETMLRQTATALGKQRPMWRVPIASTGFSKRWVQIFGSASHELVSPLIDSLQCDLPARAPAPEIARYIRYPDFAAMVKATLVRSQPMSREAIRPPSTRATVRSIQRLPCSPNRDARFIGDEYMNWLGRIFYPLIVLVREGPRYAVTLLGLRLLVLEHVTNASAVDRDEFTIVGGLLAKTAPTGWLEFRQVAGRRFTLGSLHEFVPALPWPLYILTQAPLHAWVMRAFGRHLARLERGK